MKNRMSMHHMERYSFNIVEDYERAIIELEHPEDSNRYYTVAVSSPETPIWYDDDEEWAEYYKEMRKALEERFNPHNYWHEVKITLEYIIDGEIYRKEI